MVSRLIAIIAFFALPAPILAAAQPTSVLPIPSFIQPIASLGAAGTIDMDLIVEADTYVPYFYAGRHEPIPGSIVRLTVIPASSTIKPASYRWQIGNQNIATTSATASFTFPAISSDVTVTVTAVDQNGRSLGSISENIRASKPLVLFYENNGLRGVSNLAIGKSLTLIGDEVALRVEPYFFGARSILTRANGTWSARDLDVITEEDWRNASLIRRENGKENAVTNVRLDIKGNENLSETVSGTFQLNI